MSDFRKALLWTIIPIAGVAVLSTLLSRVPSGLFERVGLPNLAVIWFLAAGMDALAILMAIAFAIRRNFHAAAGIITGVALGIVALGLTCFANLSLVKGAF